eukprot:scaffold2668_cov115-Isochrysis_galbana.AAC.22
MALTLANHPALHVLLMHAFPHHHYAEAKGASDPQAAIRMLKSKCKCRSHHAMSYAWDGRYP